MKRAMSMMRVRLLKLISVLLLAACETATPTPTPPISPSATPEPTLQQEPTAQATTPAPDTPTLTLGDPRWLGRGQIVDAAFMPEAATVAIGWANGVSLVTLEGATELWWQPASAQVIAIAIHPQGEAVAAALGDGSVMVIDAISGNAQRFEGARPNAHWGDIAWSPVGQWIAFQFIGPNRGDPIFLLNVESGSLDQVPDSQVDEGTIPWLLWSPDGRAITRSSLGDKCSQLVDVNTGEVVLSLEAAQGCYAPWVGAWPPNGSLLALAGSAGVDLLDPMSWKVVRTLEGGGFGYLPGNRGAPLVFSPDGSRLASLGGLGFYGDAYSTVVWDVTTGERIVQIGRELPPVYEGGEARADEDWAYVQSLADREPFALGFDGSNLLLLYENGELGRWAVGAEPAGEEISGQIPVVASEYPLIWSANGSKIAAHNRYGGVAVWDVETGALDATFDAPLGAPALSPDARLVALTNPETSEEVVYDLDTGEVVLTLPDSTSLPQATAFSPDGRWIAYGSRNPVLVADVASGEQAAVLAGYPDDHSITRVIWSPNGDALIAASGDPYNGTTPGLLILWEQSGDGSFEDVFQTRTTRTGYESEPLALFNSTGNFVAFEHLPRLEAGQFKIRIYDREAGEVIRTLDEYQLAAWVADEILLASEAQYWTRLTQWNVRTGESLVGFGHESGGNVYSPDGMYYAQQNIHGPSIGRGIEIQYWKSAAVIERVMHGSEIIQIIWSPDGRRIASVAADGTIRVWPIKP